jgi:indolepyruvate ferredoxin oxidoreductase beta subunit
MPEARDHYEGGGVTMALVKNVLLVGVGGQGTILASKILTQGLLEAGYDVKMSEVHGMSQRGGSVTTQVRYGDKVYSPIIGKGEGDVLVAFETMEAMRLLDGIKPSGTVVVNDYRIPSVPILSGERTYPDNLLEVLASKVKVRSLNAWKIAEGVGSARAMNVVLLGALVKALGATEVDWESVIGRIVSPKTVELNIKAFRAGLEA